MDEAKFPRKAYRRYDWVRMFGTVGKSWRLIQGRDFDVALAQMRETILAQARRRGAGVQTSIVKDEKAVYVLCEYAATVVPNRSNRGEPTTRPS